MLQTLPISPNLEHYKCASQSFNVKKKTETKQQKKIACQHDISKLAKCYYGPHKIIRLKFKCHSLELKNALEINPRSNPNHLEVAKQALVAFILI